MVLEPPCAMDSVKSVDIELPVIPGIADKGNDLLIPIPISVHS